MIKHHTRGVMIRFALHRGCHDQASSTQGISSTQGVSWGHDQVSSTQGVSYKASSTQRMS